MTQYAKLLNPDTIDEIATLNEGVRPGAPLDNTQLFIYSDDPEDYNEIIEKDDFNGKYYWLDRTSNDNGVGLR